MLRLFIYLSICSIALLVFSCNQGYRKLRKEAEKLQAKTYYPTEQYDNCQGYRRYLGRMKGGCIFEDLHCLENGRGTYCLVSKCSDTSSLDTICYVEFKINPDYDKKVAKKKNYGKKPLEYFTFIADGKAYFADGRCDIIVNIPNVYIMEDVETDPPIVNTVSTYRMTNYGIMNNWCEGEWYGRFENGKKEGRWIFNYQETLFADTEGREVYLYKDGKKNGVAYIYNSYGYEKGDRSWLQTPIGIHMFKDGQEIPKDK